MGAICMILSACRNADSITIQRGAAPLILTRYTSRFVSKYFTNTLWILGEKVLTLGVSFALSIWLARHLGPEKFGMFSYGIALVGLFSMLGHLGLEGLTVRELVNNPGNQT